MTKPIPNIEPILKLLLDYNQALAMRDISTPYIWINSGCDIEQDIMPTIKEILKRRNPAQSKIATFSYFTNAVLSARDKRNSPVLNKKEPTKEESDAVRAANIRWHKDRNLTTTKVGRQDFEWLEKYDARINQQ